MTRRLAVAALLLLAGAALWLWSEYSAEVPPPETAQAPAPVAKPPPEPEAEAEPPPTTGHRSLKGRMLTDDDKPIGGVDVEVFTRREILGGPCEALAIGCSCGEPLEAAMGALARDFKVLGIARTGVDGKFAFTDLPEGPLELRAKKGREYGAASVEPDESEADVGLWEPLAAALRVVEDGKGPREGVPVLAISALGVVDVQRSRADGVVTPFAGAGASYRAFVSGFALASLDEGSEDDEKPAAMRDLRLVRGELVHGRLDGADAGVAVTVTALDPGLESFCAVTKLGAGGTWVVGPLPGKRFHAEAPKPERVDDDGPLEPIAQPPRPEKLSDGGLGVIGNATVRGDVVDEQGAPVPGAKVSLWQTEFGGGSSSGQIEIEVDARSHFEHTSKAGELSLRADAEGFNERTVHERVEEGATWEPKLVLSRAVFVSGRVEDSTGQPIKGAQVSVMTQGMKRERAEQGFSHHAMTGETGTFRIPTYAGEVEVTAHAQSYLPLPMLRVTAPAEGLRFVMKRGLSVQGRVLDKDHQPVAHVSVMLSGSGRTNSSTSTKPDGTFTADALEPGSYEVRAVEYAPREGSRDARMIAPAASRSASRQVEVDASTPPIELILEPVPSVEGKVIDESGVPVAGVTVVAGRPRTSFSSADPKNLSMQLRFSMMSFGMSPPFGASAPRTVTDANGGFTFTGLSEPSALLLDSTTLRADPGQPINVTPGMRGVVVTAIHPHFLTADLVSTTGQPITNARLEWFALPAPGGHLSWEIKVSGSGPLRFSAAGHVPVTREVTLSPRADVALGTIRLTPGREVQSHVTDAATGAVLSNAWWKVGGVMPVFEQKGDDQLLILPEGEVTLECSSADHVPTVVHVGASQTSVSVQLDTGGVVTGTVHGADGKRPNAHTWVAVSGCPNEVGAFIDSDGTFKVKAVGPGTCSVAARLPNGGAAGPAKQVTMGLHGAATVELVVPPG